METEELLQEMHTTMASINAYLAILTEEVENKKKKVDKKKNNTQRKKRNIVYTKKTNGEIAIETEFDKNLTTEERTFYQSMAKEFPKICMMDEPLMFEQFKKLTLKYNRRDVILIMNQMENYAKISKYVSAYKALDNWLIAADNRK